MKARLGLFAYRFSQAFTMTFLIIFLVACSVGNTYPISGLQLKSYPSVIDAVEAASNLYNPISIETDREFMGAILERDNRYFYTAVAGSVGTGNVRLSLPPPYYGEVIALWHTHGKAAKAHQFFSAIDVNLVKRLELPFYLADHTGELKVLYPNSTTISPLHAKSLGLQGFRGIATGQFVKGENKAVIKINTNVLANK